MAADGSRYRLVRVLSILLAVVLIPIALYIFVVLEPQRQHMLARNVRVLAETGRELEAQMQRLTPLLQFSLVPRGRDSQPDEWRRDLSVAVEKLRKAEADEDVSVQRVLDAEIRRLKQRQDELESRSLAGLRGESAKMRSLAFEQRAYSKSQRQRYVESERTLSERLHVGDRLALLQARREEIDEEAAARRPQCNFVEASDSRVVSEARASCIQAKQMVNYIEGLRKTPEYRAIVIEAFEPKESSAPPDPHAPCVPSRGAPPARELTGVAQPLTIVAEGCRADLPEKPGGELRGTRVRITLPFSDLMAPLDEAATSAFDQLVIASDDGRVMHASAGGPIAAADRLDRLLVSAPSAGTLERLRQLAQGGESGGAVAAPGEAASALAAARGHPVELELDQARYLVFVHPLKAQASRWSGPATEASTPTDATAAADWYVVGLVSDKRFRRDSMASSRSQLALAVSGLVMLALAWPWLRLLLSGPRERLGIRHILELVTSLALAVGLLTLLVADLVTGVALQRNLDATARDVALRMEGDLRRELVESLHALRDARRRICVTSEASTHSTSHLEWETKNEATSFVYPPYDVAFVLDESGEQVGEQANYRMGEVSHIRVSDRPYFTHVRDGKLWSLQVDGEPAEQAFLQRIKTYDHGWRLTAVSAPVAPEEIEGTECESGGVIAAALTRRFDSLTSTVLPPGFGFALIDDDGRVVFHSSDSRSLVENFLAETGSDWRLRTLVKLRRARAVDGRYRAEGAHRFSVQPVRDLPWTLVVFQRDNLYDLLRVDMLLAAGSHLILYVLGLLTAGLLIAWLAPGSRASWFWPDERLRARYWRGAVFVGVLFGFQMLSVLWLRGVHLLLPILTLPPAALGFVYLALQGDGPRRRGGSLARLCVVAGAVGTYAIVFLAAKDAILDPRPMVVLSLLAIPAVLLAASWALSAPNADAERSRNGQRAYLGLLFALLLVCVVGPSFALFKDVQRAQLDRLTRHGERVAVDAQMRRAAALRVDAARLDPERFGGPRPALVERSDTARCRGFYVQPSLVVSAELEGGRGAAAARSAELCDVVEATPNPCLETMDDYRGAFTTWLTRRLPGFSTTSVELRQLFDAGSDDDSECWLSVVPGGAPSIPRSLGLGGIEYRRGGLRMLAPRLPIPQPETVGAWFLAGLGVGAVVVVALLLLWLLATRVLGLGVPDVMGSEAPASDDELLGCNRLVLFPPPGWAAALAARASRQGFAVEHVDAKSDPATWTGSSPVGEPLLIVEDLHLVLPLEDQREKVRAALSEILRAGRYRVVICSDVNPLDYLRTSRWQQDAAAASGSVPDDANAEKATRALDLQRLRWGALLAQVHATRVTWTPEDLGETGKASPRLVGVLHEECDWSPWLMEVRAEIAADPRFRSGELDERQLVHWVVERAEPLFRRIWALLPAEDRLAVIQLAEGDLLNPRNETTVERLMRRGLVRRAPSFRLVSRAFGLFARRVERPERVSSWERGATGGAWELARLPLALAFLLILGYAVYAGRDSVDATLAVIPALAAGFPTVVRLLSTLRVASTASGGAGGVG